MANAPSTRFPFINLSKALERAEALFENDRRGNGLKMASTFAAWSYSDKSSGGFQTVAALKGYGLLADDGSKADRSVKLTDSARRYFMTEIEDEHAELRQQFALHPKLMRHLFERWGNDPPSDPVARSYLKTEVGLNDQSARASLGIFKDNLTFASPKGLASMTEPELRQSGEDTSEAEVTVERPQAHPSRVATSATAFGPIVSANGPSLNVTRVADGYVIHLGGSVLTKAHADEVIKLLTALKTTLKRTS